MSIIYIEAIIYMKVIWKSTVTVTITSYNIEESYLILENY